MYLASARSIMLWQKYLHLANVSFPVVSLRIICNPWARFSVCVNSPLLVLMTLCQLALLACQAQLCPAPTTGWWWHRPFSNTQPWCTQVLVAVLEKGLIPSPCVTFSPGYRLCSIPVKLKLLLKAFDSEWIHALGMSSLSSKVSFILWWLVFWLVLDISINFSFFFTHSFWG